MEIRGLRFLFCIETKKKKRKRKKKINKTVQRDKQSRYETNNMFSYGFQKKEVETPVMWHLSVVTLKVY